MEGWHEYSRITSANPTVHDPMPTSVVTARVFDTTQSLVWSGDNTGRVASFYLTHNGLTRYTSFKAHTGPVTEIYTNPNGIITSSSECVRLHNRRGIVKQSVQDSDLKGIAAMAMASKGSSEIVVGGEGDLGRINIDRGILASKVPHTTGSITRMARGSMMIGAGLNDGKIELIDPNSMNVVHSFNGHQGPIIDMDFQGTTLVTCGYSVRKTGYFPDPMVNVFDTRAMKPLAPIAFPAGATFVKMHPKTTTCCFVVGTTGQIQIVDFTRPTDIQIYQAAISSSVTGVSVSGTGDYMALTDGDGSLHLWCNEGASGQFTEFPAPLEYPTATDSVHMDWDENEPLSKVGMPYYKEALLSSWSDPIYVFDNGKQAAKIDPDILKRSRTNSIGLRFASNTKKIPRNFTQDNRRSSVTVPKFKSEKRDNEQDEEKNILFGETVRAGKIAKAYRKLEIKYSKFGIEDFDFDFYNSTNYSGLETQQSNSYCNALLQLFRFSPLFYNFAINAVAQKNNAKPSLLNEFGLLFDMLHKANGHACRAGNFLKTLKWLPEAKQFLYDDLSVDSRGKPLGGVSEASMVQELTKYMMAQVTQEAGNSFLEIAAFPVTYIVQRQPCGYESQQKDVTFTMELVPPTNQSGSRKSGGGFIPILRKSFEKWTQTTAYCDHCGEYQHAGVMHTVRGLPKLVLITIPADDTSRPMWENESSWPSRTFYASSQRGKIQVRGPGASNENKAESKRYDLIGMICEIGSQGERDNHLVTIAKTENGWHLFNDFLVKELDEQEAFDFTVRWKQPVMLLYQEKGVDSFDYESWKSHMDTSLLYKDYFIQGEMEHYRREYELLTQEEAPRPGTLVAMDAEFVKIREEEIEIRADMSKSVVIPAMLSLARVSVLRGEGPKFGVPFIDDYIATTEPIVDYLTNFSGIEVGDLDPSTSEKGLVTLQTSYKKLWLLLNLGCIFIGHGLKNDFRTINIQVPESQVIDTVNIFYEERSRKLSLKFLAWFLLDEKVQTGNHDSIEDARTALLLYKESERLRKEGTLQNTIKRIYAEGQMLRFRPPESFADQWQPPSVPGTPK